MIASHIHHGEDVVVSSGSGIGRTDEKEEEESEASDESEDSEDICSITQREEQPSPSNGLASSHSSPSSKIPFPQTGRGISSDTEDSSEELSSAAAYSISQTLEQPSPSKRFPSSHCSGGMRMPSPQTGRQEEGWPKQE